MTPKIVQTAKILNFLRFNTIFVNFSIDVVDFKMLKKFNKPRIHCPVVVYEEISSFFLERKRPKNDKKQKKIPDNKRFYAICNFLSNFRYTSWITLFKMLIMALIRCLVGCSEKIIAFFRIDIENDKNFEIFQFSKF